MKEVNKEQIEQAVRQILEAIGEDPNREGLLDTPKRVAKMYAEVFSGLNEDPKEHFQTIFGENHEELVLVKDIAFHSMCEHHLVPFYGKHMLHISREAERSQDSANWHVPLKPLQSARSFRNASLLQLQKAS